MKVNYYKDIKLELDGLADKKKAQILSRFFKTGPGQYGEGDIFLGISVPEQRKVAARHRACDLKSLERLLASSIHEHRLTALIILVSQYEREKDMVRIGELFKFYQKNYQRINNWDLVDTSAPKILGHFLFNYCTLAERKEYLVNLASSQILWERRIAMVSTMYAINQGSATEAFLLVKRLLSDPHDLMHKACGWMLREVGKKVGRSPLLEFLDEYGSRLPRTALRYAIEHLPEKQRKTYLAL